MQITINTELTTTGNAGFVAIEGETDGYTFSAETIVSGLTQEIDGIPVDLIESFEEAERGEVEPMFGEDGEYLSGEAKEGDG